MSRLTFFAILILYGAGVLPAAPRSDPIASRVAPPAGFERVPVADGSFAATLRSLKLKPRGTNVGNRQEEETLCGEEIVAVIDELSLPVEEGKGASGIIKLWGMYRWTKGRRTDIRFDLENGQSAAWRDWRDGLRPHKRQGRILFVQVGVPDGSKANYLRYLTFVAENAGTISLKRDLEIVLAGDLAPGDIIVSTGSDKGRVGFLLDVCRNADRQRLFLLGMGGEDGSDLYIPSPYEPVQGEGGWFTLDGARYAVGLGQCTVLRRFKFAP